MSEELNKALLQPTRKLRRYHVMRWAWIAWGVLALCLPVLIGIDMAFHLSSDHRSLAMLVWSIMSILGLISVIVLVFVLPMSANKVVDQLESLEPSLGSSLSNALDFEKQIKNENLKGRSRDIAEEALGWYGKDIKSRDLKKPLDKLSNIKRFGIFVVSCLLILLPAIWGFRVYSQQWQRLVDPHGNHPAYSRTQLIITEPVEDPALVHYNKDLRFKVEWTGDEPDEVNLRLLSADRKKVLSEVPMLNKGELGYLQKVEHVKEDLWVEAVSGDGRSVSPAQKIEVQMIPILEKTELEVKAPSYTHRQSRKQEYKGGKLKVLEGTKLIYTFKSNRRLKGGEATYVDIKGKKMIYSLQSNEDGLAYLEMNPEDSGSLSLVLTDREGFSSERLSMGQITMLKDMPPEIHFIYPTNDAYVSVDVNYEVKFEMFDDIGLKEFRLHRRLNGMGSAPFIVPLNTKESSSSQSYTFKLKDLGVQGGDMIQLYADVIDSRPEPQLAKTEVRNIMVISEEDYNNYLRERSEIDDLQFKYSQLMERFHNLVDSQKELNEELNKINEAVEKGELSEAEAQKERDKAMAKQSELQQQMKKMAREMKDFVREKPLYDIEKEFSESLKKQAEKIEEAVKDMQDSQDQSESQTPSQQLSEMQKAGEELVEQLEQPSREKQEQIEQVIADLSKQQKIIQDIEALKRLTLEQKSIAEQCSYLNADQALSRSDKLSLMQLGQEQQKVGAVLKQVVENLRKHAEEAKDVFPKSAESAVELANKIDEMGMEFTADSASQAMRMSNVVSSQQLSEQLYQDFMSLYGQCNSTGQKQSNEIDRYLGLTQSMKSGQTFQQMCKSGFLEGNGQNGQSGSGQGQTGSAVSSSASGQMASPNFDVYGKEPSRQESRESKRGPSDGHGKPGEGVDVAKVQLDEVDRAEVEQERQLKTKAVDHQKIIPQYREIVHEYFKAVTEDTP